MLLSEYFKDITGRFKEAGIDTASLDAEILLSHGLEIDNYKVVTEGSRKLLPDEIKKVEKLVKKRLKFEPVAYILGSKEFYSLDFIVNRNVLIPRPETELLVDMAIYWAGMNASVLDICTGSGAVAVALKKSRSDVTVFASDLSSGALKTARKNSNRILGKNMITFKEGDLFEPFSGRTFDVITANPPYVDPDEKNNLQQDLLFEPEIALYAGNHGREVISQIISQAGSFLKPGGILLMEIGADQKEFIIESGEKEGYSVSVLNDYAGLPRIGTFKKNQI